MPETHEVAHGNWADDQFFRRYGRFSMPRTAAFDELEHAYEDGDRSAFDVDLEAWRSAVTHRESFLERNGFTATTPLVL
jgi:hypothetical protein